MRSVVLVEGESDQRAVEAMARVYGRNLAAEGVAVVAMGGATSIGRALAAVADDVRIFGLVDEREAGVVERALRRAGRGASLAAAGFFVCVRDLEDELIRALGVSAVEQVLAAEGDLDAYRLFQRQPAQRERSDVDRLRRFLGTRSGRKIHYGATLVTALGTPERMPAPLARLQARM